MPAVPILFHDTQKPAKLRDQLVNGLKGGSVPHKFLYDSHAQTARWLALHQACSPSRVDPDCISIYEDAFRFSADRLQGNPAHLVGIGCGGGKKDARLLRALGRAGMPVYYTAIDVGAAMVLTASEQAVAVIPPAHCARVVADISSADDLGSLLQQLESAWTSGSLPLNRVATFFGIIPNFRPSRIMPVLGRLLRPKDVLLFSANLAPGSDYVAGTRKVLPQYDNSHTREWLGGFLDSIGISRIAGEMRFLIETVEGLQRITAEFVFKAPWAVRFDDEEVRFDPGKPLRLFYSFRHTPKTIAALLDAAGFGVLEQWITRSGEEGVFAAERRSQ